MGKKEKTVVHTGTKPISKFQKVFLFILAQLLLTSAIFMGALAYNQTQYKIDYNTEVYYVNDDILASKTSFEDSYAFEMLFRKSIEDVIYLSVIKNQFENRGVFDGNKVIDITDYAYRRNEEDKSGVKAEYHLDDLLKWARNGIEFNEWPGYYVALYNYGVPSSQYQVLAIPDYAYLTDTKGNYIPETWMLQPLNYALTNVCYNLQINEIVESNDGEYYCYVNLLKDKYRTVDGKTIGQLVNNWPDYYDMINNLDVTISNLETNYRYYQSLNPYYYGENTNVKYCVRLEDSNGKYVYHTNVDGIDKMSEKEINMYFANDDAKYIIYSPDDLAAQTNTNLSDVDMSNVVGTYDLGYMYNDKAKVWLSVDSSYKADDAFAQAYAKYNSGIFPPVYCLLTAIVCTILFGVIMLYLTVKTGWIKTKDGKKALELTGIDELPTEVFISVAVVFVLLTYAAMGVFIYGDLETIDTVSKTLGVFSPLVFSCCIFAITCFVGALYLSFIRRVKAGTLFKNTLIARMFRAIGRKYTEAASNRKGSLGVFLTFFAYLVGNCIGLLLVFLFLENTGTEFIGAFGFALLVIANFAIGLFHIRCRSERFEIIEGIERIKSGETEFKLNTEAMHGMNVTLAEAANHIGDGIHAAVETSMKDEKMKADLITNVSHDIKTPLTSIINYVDLLKRENIQDEKVKGYIEVLDEKSQRLKQLTVDLVEASKISSGNVTYEVNRINYAELINQAVGEFEDRFAEKNLTVITDLNADNPYVMADARHTWRVMENLFINVCKYAMPGTRVYINLYLEEITKINFAIMSVRNISAQELNISADELTERFIRGDKSRTTEGSGLGLSIAKSLTEGQKGKFGIYLDGDLFKVSVALPSAEAEVVEASKETDIIDAEDQTAEAETETE